jgi:hypothetical protein
VQHAAGLSVTSMDILQCGEDGIARYRASIVFDQQVVGAMSEMFM